MHNNRIRNGFLAYALVGIALLCGGCGVSDDDGGDDDDPPTVDIDAPTAPPVQCGNGLCEGNELSTCQADCPVCGDGTCNGSETSSTCPGDCPLASSTLVVRNTSAYSIYRIYIASCASTVWGSNWLGTAVLQPNYMVTFPNVPPGCTDFRAENSTNIFWQRLGTEMAPSGTFTWTLL